VKNLFLIVHGLRAYVNGGLTGDGENQALDLAIKFTNLKLQGKTKIISSSILCSMQTADIIRYCLNLDDKIYPIIGAACLEVDFSWLKNEMDNFDGDNLIVISHRDYVNRFPVHLGFKENQCCCAEGVLIRGGECIEFFDYEKTFPF